MVLENMRMHFRRIGIFIWAPNVSERDNTIFLNCALLFAYTVYMLTILFELIFYAETFGERSEGFLFSVGSILVFSWYIICVRKRQSYQTIFNQLNEIVEKRSRNSVSKEIYEKNSNKIETATKWLLPISILYATTYVSLAAATSFYKYFSSGGRRDSFRRAYPAAFPFDWRTPLGYLATALVQIICFSPPLYLCSLVTSLNLACCSFIAIFISDINLAFRQLNDSLTNLPERHKTIGKAPKLAQTLNEIKKFHMDARQFTIRFSETGKPVIFVFLMFSWACNCNVLLQINKAFDSGSLPIMIQSILMMLFTGCTLYFFCHFGDNATQVHTDLGDTAYQLAWYYLPIKMQKDLMLFIASSQRRIYIEGNAGARCTREIFMKILNKTLSYFMVLRKF